ncbi:putative 3-oxoacyl-[acyl-carrier-protein] reductase [Nitrospira tepida]|uniref:3-oxoacyl-[acyl-carrier-protein] reductase n=1 Tax=Nitrospira tepida TaxID=2973512 RepID=A0AA86T734_9BACT|nr:SDR family oxidoreductase [Nitrospira tepida]CAI4032837.1 putative 3-oxoacyl-[acyl-carrier-protein] reductase [Nitrospira tepida]
MDNDTQKHTGPPVVVVTGASAGVGRAIVRRFAREGALIGLLARGVDGLTAARQEVEQAGGKALVLPTDVADAEQVEQATAKVEQQLGPIDIWINNAMVSVLSPAMDMTPEEYRRVTEVTYLGYVHGTLAALRRMLPRDRGVIIQIGSALAYRSIPLQSAYCGAKHAVQGFTESLRSELIHDGSRVSLSTVHLPAVNTPQFSWIRSRMPRHPQPVPPIYQPEVIADAVHWVAYHPRREFWIGFPTVKAIVGDKFIPGLLDHYLAHVGYDSQQTGDPIDPDRPDNLHSPLPGDYGAHGLFDGGARTSSLQVWANQHRGPLLFLAAAMAGLWLMRTRRAADRQPRRNRAIHAPASR